MLFSDGADTTAGGSSDSTAGNKSGDGERGDDKEALRRMGEQRDAAREALKAAERERDALRTKAQQLEDKDKTDLERITSERDRLKTDLDTRETRLREMAITQALTIALSHAGARHSDLLVKDLASKAELGDDLTVKNVEKLVADAKKARPDMFRVVEGRADGGEGRDDGASKTTNMNRLIRQRAGYAG